MVDWLSTRRITHGSISLPKLGLLFCTGLFKFECQPLHYFKLPFRQVLPSLTRSSDVHSFLARYKSYQSEDSLAAQARA